MLNTDKIRVMTKLSMYEKKEGKDDLKVCQYYKTDYIRLHVIRTIVSITIGYLITLILIGLYQLNYLIEEAVHLNYTLLATYIIGIYLMILVVYVLITMIGYNIKYNRARKEVARYLKGIKYLRQLYRDEEQK